MKLKRYAAIVSALIFLLGLLAAAAAGDPGSAGDPVASLSYIQDTFIPKVMGITNTKVSDAYGSKVAEASSKVEEVFGKAEANLALNSQELKDRITYSAYMQMLDNGFYMQSGAYSIITLNKGERLVVSQFGSFTLREGSAVIGGGANASVVNVSDGGPANTNTAAVKFAKYIITDDVLISIKALSDQTKIAVEGKYQIIPPYLPQYTDMALTLKDIGLFRGSNLGFELDREPTRLEALILFLRLIGEEQQALAYTGKHPFSDVPKWGGDAANKYVAYAYSKGYTNGVSKTRFGTSDTATAEQYLTFVLRALGYKDGADFSWANSAGKAEEIGILLAGDKEKILRRGFYRDHVVYISYYSLQACLKDTTATLISSLEQKGVITQEMAQKTVGAYPR
jgi:Tfp pilus assembly protein PilZ